MSTIDEMLDTAIKEAKADVRQKRIAIALASMKPGATPDTQWFVFMSLLGFPPSEAALRYQWAARDLKIAKNKLADLKVVKRQRSKAIKKALPKRG